MSFLKLCQLSNETYIENSEGEVILAISITFPLQLACEVIDWESEEEYTKRGKALSFISESITINQQPDSIREAVYQQLLLSYPNLQK
jgi:hypothetical protein